MHLLAFEKSWILARTEYGVALPVLGVRGWWWPPSVGQVRSPALESELSSEDSVAVAFSNGGSSRKW